MISEIGRQCLRHDVQSFGGQQKVMADNLKVKAMLVDSCKKGDLYVVVSCSDKIYFNTIPQKT